MTEYPEYDDDVPLKFKRLVTRSLQVFSQACMNGTLASVPSQDRVMAEQLLAQEPPGGDPELTRRLQELRGLLVASQPGGKFSDECEQHSRS